MYNIIVLLVKISFLISWQGAWEIEEVDFNIKGLSMDCFLPPSDLKKEEEREKNWMWSGPS